MFGLLCYYFNKWQTNEKCAAIILENAWEMCWAIICFGGQN
jgi:hypothetical protein